MYFQLLKRYLFYKYIIFRMKLRFKVRTDKSIKRELNKLVKELRNE